MRETPWFCEIREHTHSSEEEARWCTELYDLWQLALASLLDYVREDEVTFQVNSALADADGPEEDA